MSKKILLSILIGLAVLACLAGLSTLNSTMQFKIGTMYFKGSEIVSKNYLKAFQWYKKSADQGNVNAQLKLAAMYSDGTEGAPQDDGKAANLYLQAAAQGNVYAETALGDIYYAGKGLSQDYDKAASWYLKMASNGNAHVESRLGELYELGNGVAQDTSKAIYWYSKAASQGQATAAWRLGDIYNKGDGIPLDSAKALYWHQKAIDEGVDKNQSETAVSNSDVDHLINRLTILGADYDNGANGAPQSYLMTYILISLKLKLESKLPDRISDFKSTSEDMKAIDILLIPSQKAAADTFIKSWEIGKPIDWTLATTKVTHGEMTLFTGERYQGDIQNGQPNGKGISISANHVYQGAWQAGLPNGHGIISMPDGKKFEGNFVNRNLNGEVIYTNTDGSRYEVNFVNNKPDTDTIRPIP